MRAYSDTYVLGAQRRLGAMLDFAVNGCHLELAEFYECFLSSGLAERFSTGEPALVAGCSGAELALAAVEQRGACAQAGAQTGANACAWAGEQAGERTGANERAGERAIALDPEGARAGALNPEGAHIAPFSPEPESLVAKARAFRPLGGAAPEYWAGWALAYYQWECGRSLGGINQLVSIERVRSLYHPFHEMDITQFCDHMDFLSSEAQPHSALKALRIAAGLSQSQLAHAAGVSVRTLQQYEQRRKDINKAQVECVVGLARALHCAVEDLLEYRSAPHEEYQYAAVKLP